MTAVDTPSETVQRDDYDDIYVIDVVKRVWRGKWLIAAVTALFAIASVLVVLFLLPNRYQATILLSPTSAISGGSQLPGGSQVAGLAQLAGVKVGGLQSDRVALAMEIVRSHNFLASFVYREEIQIPLFAADLWNVETKELSFDRKIYNIETKTWTRKVDVHSTSRPSAIETVKKFNENLSVELDEDTGLVRLGVTFLDPNLARQWTIEIVERLNENMRMRDLNQSQQNLSFLNEKLASTRIDSLRLQLTEMIEENMRTLMLATAQTDYAFQIVDAPPPPEEASSPNRPLIVAAATLLGGILGLVIVFLVPRYATVPKDTAHR